MANELRNYVDDVYINRNVASEKMLKYSKRAYSNVVKDENKIIMGYFSGSITHNADFELIMPVIKEIMEKNEQVYLKIVGELDLPKELDSVRERVIAEPFVEWKNYRS